MNDPRPVKANSVSLQERAALYSNIPAELRLLPQWCCWRYEHREGNKPTKVPVNAKTGTLASVADQGTWATLVDAISGEATYGHDGIGFVFTINDPYCFIDLDDAKGDAEALARQRNIYEALNSYTELSPSGSGAHIIIKADLPIGRRRGGVELYPHGRFATFTGNVINNVGIAERQDLAEVLLNELGGEKAATAGIQPDSAPSEADAAIVGMLTRDPALTALYAGDLSAYGGDHSAADQALCNALAARSGNRVQAERIWRASPLGQREKTQGRADYRQRTIERAFDRAPLANVDLSGVTVNGKPLFAPASAPAATPVVIDAADLEATPASPRLDMWGGNVPIGQTTLLDAPGGVGKSLLLQQLATCVALGLPCLGVQTMPGVALYVTCEDDPAEIKLRQHEICRAMGVSLAKHRQRLAIVSLTGVIGNELAAFDQQGRMTVAPRFQWLLDTAKAIGAKFIVLDNVAHFFAGNENIRNQVAAFLGLLNKLAHDLGAAVVLVAHTNKNGEQSGSTAWSNQVRTRLTMQIPQEPSGFVPDFNNRVLTRAKSNYGRSGKAITFRWHNGAFKLEGELPNDVAEAANANVQAEADDRLFLACLAERTRQRRAVSERRSPTFAPTVFAGMAESERVGKRRLELAMDRLFKAGAIERAVLWRDTDKARDIAGLRLASPAPRTVAPNGPQTLFPNAPELATQTPPNDPLTHTVYIDKGGAAYGQPPLPQDEGGAAMLN